jgi:hypothetical protein
MATDFSSRVEILGDFYITYREDSNTKDFIEFNDLGLPLAFLASEGLAEITEEGAKYINETWTMLLMSLNLEDTGFSDLTQLFDSSPN